MQYLRTALFAAVLSCPILLHAQTKLEISRVDYTWSSIDVFFKQYCDGNQVFHGDTSDFSVTENGHDIRSFIYTVPKPGKEYSMSVALAFDISAEMDGEYHQWAKDAGSYFVDRMRDSVDEASLMRIGEDVQIITQLGDAKDELKDAIQALPANQKGRALWDGAHLAAQRLLLYGTRETKAAILLTAGPDSGSSFEYTEARDVATRHRVRIYTIALGDALEDDTLRMLADSTGGQFFPVHSRTELFDAFDSIVDNMRAAFNESRISYPRLSAWDQWNEVRVSREDLCGSAVTDTGHYYSAFANEFRRSTHYQVFSDTVVLGDTASVSIWHTTNGKYILDSYGFEITYDRTIAKFTGYSFHQSFIGYRHFDVEYHPNTLRFLFPQDSLTIGIEKTGKIVELHFATLEHPSPPGVMNVTFRDISENANLFEISYEDGHVYAYDTRSPEIIVNGQYEFCEEDSVLLTAADGFAEYEWSTGEKTQSIFAKAGGLYRVSALNPTQQRRRSKPVYLTTRDAPDVSIPLPDTMFVCMGEHVPLEPEEHFPIYKWSTGSTERSIVAREPGTFFVRVFDSSGCWGTSNSVTIVHVPYPAPIVQVLGDNLLCEGDTTTLDAGDGYHEYQWSTGSRTRTINVAQPGNYWVSVSRYGCEGESDTASIQFLPSPEKPEITRRYGGIFCEPIAASYQWLLDGVEIPDATSRFINIQYSGAYSVRITDGNGCSAVSDPLVVTSIEEPPAAIDFAATVSPNPNSGVFNLQIQSQSPKSYTIEIYNTAGRIIQRLETASQQSSTLAIDLGTAPSGMYFVTVASGGRFLTEKIMVVGK